ncbi:sugar ABC transporter substrate-binding protein [uncultured Robinsoniella sp.]|uniref:sugar ABC transporter substrate-binding protein n=1 Tax=uncultured Robinsoniella sp. TaxID=904190 RepID=UPI00374EE886
MKKKMISMVLGMAMVLTLLSGCSMGDEAKATEAAKTSEAADTDAAKETEKASDEMKETVAKAAEEATETETAKTASDTGEKLKVGFCPMDLSNPFFAQMASSAKSAAEENNVELVVTDGQSDSQKQVTALENFISQGCKAIIVVPVDGESLKTTIEEAEKSGIPVITHTTKVDAASAFISIDETDMGTTIGSECGKWMKETFGDEEVQYAILNQPTLPQIINREKGIQAGIAEYAPNAKLVTTVAAWLPDMGMEAAETILQAYPDVKAIVGINDSGALGAYEACSAANIGDQFFIGGVDGTEAGVEKIAAGTIYRASVDIGPVPTGVMMIDYAKKLCNGEEVPKETMVEVKAINKDNAQEYLDAFKEVK